MATLDELAARFSEKEREAGNILGDEAVKAQALAATLFYYGYGYLTSAPEIVGGETEISDSEWALIRPLFLLYVERETALQLEASRGLGLDVFGRSASEVAADINAMEAEMPRRAFYQPIVTV